jgi:hypothetical protein
MSKQTAVEWLITEVKKFNTIITREYMLMLFDQAKQMEKEQIIEAYYEGKEYGFKEQGEQYYKETYDTNTTTTN